MNVDSMLREIPGQARNEVNGTTRGPKKEE